MNREEEYIKSHCTDKIWEELSNDKRQLKSIKKTFQRELDAVRWADEHPKSHWIKCSERLPEVGDVVLASDGKYTHICEFSEETPYDKEYREKCDASFDGRWLNMDSMVNYLRGVKAWMPIPKFEEE